MSVANLYLVFLCISVFDSSYGVNDSDILCQIKCIENGKKFENDFKLGECQEKCTNFQMQNEDNGFLKTNSSLSIPVLHCRTEDTISVSWQPWIFSSHYFLALFNSQDELVSTTTTLDFLYTFENLSTDSEYQVKLWGVEGVKGDEDRVWGPAVSSLMHTLPANFAPKPVNSLQVREMNLTNGIVQVVVQWTPNQIDQGCFYELVWFGDNSIDGYTQYEFRMQSPRFEVMLDRLEFSSNYSVAIMSKSKDWARESNKTWVYFYTPTCLEALADINLCPPAQPFNLTLNENFVKIIPDSDGEHKDLYDVTVAWNSPEFEPSHYAVILQSLLSSETHYFLTVPGNATQAIFHDIDVGLHYHVSVTAYSPGGSSEPASLYRQISHSRLPPPPRHQRVIATVALTTIVLLIILATGVYVYHRRAKRRRYERRCKYFEDLEKKEPKSIECITDEEGKVTPELDQWELRPERLVLQSLLGEGAFGLVRRAWLRDEKGNASTEVAVKMLKDTPTQEQTRHFIHEIEIMKTVGSHPHLVSMVGCCTRPPPGRGSMMLVVEFCALGDLQNYLRFAWDRMTSAPDPVIQYADLVSPASSEGSANLIINKLYDLENSVTEEANLLASDLLSFARQIAVGMEYLSSLKVLHRDLAARNVLVCSDKTVKIADFGLSRDVYRDNMYRKLGNGKLPIRWMAIESLTHQMYTSQSDVWSFGILLWEIVTLGGNPYPSVPTNALLKLLRSGYRMERPSNCGLELYTVMLSCWRVRPKDRPTFTELRKSLDVLLESVTTSKYLDLELLMSTEFASFRLPPNDSTSLSSKNKNKNSSANCSENRYVHPVHLNNAKNSSGNSDCPMLIK